MVDAAERISWSTPCGSLPNSCCSASRSSRHRTTASCRPKCCVQKRRAARCASRLSSGSRAAGPPDAPPRELGVSGVPPSPRMYAHVLRPVQPRACGLVPSPRVRCGALPWAPRWASRRRRRWSSLMWSMARARKVHGGGSSTARYLEGRWRGAGGDLEVQGAAGRTHRSAASDAWGYSQPRRT